MLTQPILETTRLILRPLSPADALSLQRIASMREIADAMMSVPHPYPDGEAEQYIRRQISEMEAGHSFVFGIECKPENIAILNGLRTAPPPGEPFSTL